MPRRVRRRTSGGSGVTGTGVFPRRLRRGGRLSLIGATAGLVIMCGPDAAARALSTTYALDLPGSYSFNVPDGVTKLTIVAVGAPGGSCPQTPTVGGWGAAITASAAVSTGERLHITVGGPGGNCGPTDGGDGGSNGGGAGGRGAPPGNLGGAGGGGATSVDEQAPTAGPLVVASGGGGAAAGVNPNFPYDPANGGDPGKAGGDLGGSAATKTQGGVSSGVSVHNDSDHGFNGAKGAGGAGGGGTECNVTSPTIGAGNGGGGGGGGYFGGGGGAWCLTPGGGGSGSTFLAPTLTALLGPVPSVVPSGVSITYSAPPVEVSTGSIRFGSEPTGDASTARTLTVTNLGSSPLVISGALLEGADPGDFRIGDGCLKPVAPGSSCRLTVRFDPRAQGQQSAILKLLTSSDMAPLAVDLSGGRPTSLLGTSGKGQSNSKVALLTCKAAGDGPGLVCTDRIASGSLKLPATGDEVRVTLISGQVSYATGVSIAGPHGGTLLALQERRPLTHGEYVLTVRSVDHGASEREPLSLT
jgi:hypothetical protein